MLRYFAPKTYWTASQVEKERVVNGAGPRDFGWMVPDTMYGLNQTEPANIHDWMYEIGRVLEDKMLADRVYLNNLNRTIKYNYDLSGEMMKRIGAARVLKELRLRRALSYYQAVKHFGAGAFWAEKNSPEEERQVDEHLNH